MNPTPRPFKQFPFFIALLIICDADESYSNS